MEFLRRIGRTSCAMRAGKLLSVSSADIRRLAEVVLLTADGVGTNEIMRRGAKSKTCVWRWQERFIEEGSMDCSATRRVPRASSRSAPRRLSASSRGRSGNYNRACLA